MCALCHPYRSRPVVRIIDNAAIKAHADKRFRSEYDYALFEYFRSAKVLAFLELAGVRPGGRVLDAGCGGGGMPLSLAEESARVVGIDLVDRFRDAGTRLAREKHLRNLDFVQADGTALPFAAAAFDAVLSHAVIEHVADADRYLAQCRRVLKPGGWMYLSTAPYLSFAGAHLPRLKVPVPLHLLIGRRAAFASFRLLARHAPWTLREPADENSFIKAARRNARQARRPARAGPRAPAARASRPGRVLAGTRRAAPDRHLPQAARAVADLAARQRTDAGHRHR